MTEQRGGKDGNEGSRGEKPEMSKISPIAPTTKQAKHWAKQYRTEIAASTSSVLSTFVAVSQAYLESRGVGTPR